MKQLNKKVAAMMFAVGLGVTLSPAAFASCQGECYQEYKACLFDGGSTADCIDQRDYCYASCAGG